MRSSTAIRPALHRQVHVGTQPSRGLGVGAHQRRRRRTAGEDSCSGATRVRSIRVQLDSSSAPNADGAGLRGCARGARRGDRMRSRSGPSSVSSRTPRSTRHSGLVAGSSAAGRLISRPRVPRHHAEGAEHVAAFHHRQEGPTGTSAPSNVRVPLGQLEAFEGRGLLRAGASARPCSAASDHLGDERAGCGSRRRSRRARSARRMAVAFLLGHAAGDAQQRVPRRFDCFHSRSRPRSV